jgi:hypothetical protein
MPLKIKDCIAYVERLECAMKNGCDWDAWNVAQPPLGSGMRRCCSGRGSTGAIGMSGRLHSAAKSWHLEVLKWARAHHCPRVNTSRTRGRTVALTPLRAGTWKCGSGYRSTTAHGTIGRVTAAPSGSPTFVELYTFAIMAKHH